MREKRRGRKRPWSLFKGAPDMHMSGREGGRLCLKGGERER